MIKIKTFEVKGKYNDRFNKKICNQIKYILNDIKITEIKKNNSYVCVNNG
jgi:hypothetical protein